MQFRDFEDIQFYILGGKHPIPPSNVIIDTMNDENNRRAWGAPEYMLDHVRNILIAIKSVEDPTYIFDYNTAVKLIVIFDGLLDVESIPNLRKEDIPRLRSVYSRVMAVKTDKLWTKYDSINIRDILDINIEILWKSVDYRKVGGQISYDRLQSHKNFKIELMVNPRNAINILDNTEDVDEQYIQIFKSYIHDNPISILFGGTKYIDIDDIINLFRNERETIDVIRKIKLVANQLVDLKQHSILIEKMSIFCSRALQLLDRSMYAYRNFCLFVYAIVYSRHTNLVFRPGYLKFDKFWIRVFKCKELITNEARAELASVPAKNSTKVLLQAMARKGYRRSNRSGESDARREQEHLGEDYYYDLGRNWFGWFAYKSIADRLVTDDMLDHPDIIFIDE